ncbi:hypothetical protein [Azospirillum canadense]|uniref:hypothetical protein n=1 Tax=Azospirillum canadense TaxID=403962 RepID=UPI00222790D4|nr:hypothetical protein [Azospirillum canadense]MCW2237513.1 hypothetical protein [Azospirillum canadense]
MLFLASASPWSTQAAEPLKDWPCKEPLVAPLTAAMVWPDRHPEALAALPAERAWEADPRVRDLVEYALNPENTPTLGAEAIARFAREAGEPGRDRRAELTLALSGVVDLTNRLRGIMVEGVGLNVVRSKILAEEVNANSAALTQVSGDTMSSDKGSGNTGGPTVSDVRQARFWNLRRLDKTEDDAAMICRKLAYSERKLRTLAQAVSQAMD